MIFSKPFRRTLVASGYVGAVVWTLACWPSLWPVALSACAGALMLRRMFSSR